jgi:hypothetical protein
VFIVCRIGNHDHELQLGGHESALRAVARLLGLVVRVFWSCNERSLVDGLFYVTEFFQLDVSFVFPDLQAVVDTLLDEGVDVFE